MNSTRDLSWAEERPLRRATVIYDTQFEETRVLAEALARGFRSQDVPTDLLTVEEAEGAELERFELLALGSPTELLTCSHRMRVFLSHLKNRHLGGRYGFAFDVKIRHHPGRAAEHIHATLEHYGLRMRVEPASGYVTLAEAPAKPPSPAHEHAVHVLEPGIEAAFEAAGANVVRKIRGELLDVWETPSTPAPEKPAATTPEDPKRPKAKWPY